MSPYRHVDCPHTYLHDARGAGGSLLRLRYPEQKSTHIKSTELISNFSYANHRGTEMAAGFHMALHLCRSLRLRRPRPIHIPCVLSMFQHCPHVNLYTRPRLDSPTEFTLYPPNNLASRHHAQDCPPHVVQDRRQRHHPGSNRPVQHSGPRRNKGTLEKYAS